MVLSPPGRNWRLLSHSWPGNVRELRNLMERIVYLAPQATIEADGPIAFHVDGEAGIVERRLEVQVVPAALMVRVPRAASASG